MKRAQYHIIIFMILFLLFPNFSDGAGDTNISSNSSDTHVVDIEIAKLAAADYLPRYYPGEWEFFKYYTCYNIDGIPAANVIIFRDKKSNILSEEDLNQKVKDIRSKGKDLSSSIEKIQNENELPEDTKGKEILKLKKLYNVNRRDLYKPYDFATVITGATDKSPLIIRCYKGLPQFIVERDDIIDNLKSKKQDKNYSFGRIVYFSPLDIRYEVNKVREMDKPAEVKSMDNISENIVYQKIPNKAYTISLSEGKVTLERVSSIRKKISEESKKEKEDFKKMSEKDKNLLEESKTKREQHNISRWDKYKQLYQKN